MSSGRSGGRLARLRRAALGRLSAGLARHPRGIAVGVGALGSLVLIGALELGSGAVLAARPRTAHTTVGDIIRADADLGYSLRAGASSRSVCRFGEELIYDVSYGIEAEGNRRTVPVPAMWDRVVLFFGCSFVFGEGLDDAETLPSQFAACSPRDKVVNLGVPGHGPNHVLARLQEQPLAVDPHVPVVAVYVFIDSHVDRAVGSFHVTNNFGRGAPYYHLEGDDLVRRGDFHSGRPLRSLVYSALNKSRVLELLGFDWPPSDDEGALRLTAAIVGECGRIVLAGHPSSRFVMVVYPGAAHGDAVAARVRVPGVERLDHSELFSPRDPGMSLPYDGHPTARAIGLLAARLAGDLAAR